MKFSGQKSVTQSNGQQDIALKCRTFYQGKPRTGRIQAMVVWKPTFLFLLSGILIGMLLTPVVSIAKGYSKVFVLDTPTHDVRYVSDQVVYVEGLVDGRWVGRYWSAGARINVPYELINDDAFELIIGGRPLTNGWRWVGAHEEPPTDRGAEHFVESWKVHSAPFVSKFTPSWMARQFWSVGWR